MAKKAVSSIPAALAESIKSSIHSLEVQINLLKQVIGAPVKGKPQPVDEDEEVEEPEIDEEEEDVNPDEEDPEEGEPEEEAEEEEDDEPAGPTLKDVKKALSKFSARGEEAKAKAVKILKGYKIKHIDDLPKAKFAELLKKLK